MPRVIARILAEHAPDDDGYWMRCRRPGYGTPLREHPCVVAALAIAALDVCHRADLS